MNKLYLLCVSGLLAMSSCNLDLAPENTMVDETVYKNANTAEAALLGAYVRLNVAIAGAPNDQNYYSNVGYAYLYGDIGTDNLVAQPTATEMLAMEKSQYSDNEHEGLLLDLWRYGYNGIDYANNIIAGIQTYGAYDATLMQQHIAEAKFIRAYIYLQLLQLFGDQALMGNDAGLGLVLRLEPYEGYNPEQITERATNAQTWEQILNDLRESINDLPETASGVVTERIRATRPVAQALLSRAYLYKGTYTNNRTDLEQARDYASAVLACPAYTFATTCDEYLTNLFPNNVYDSSGSTTQPTNRSNEIIFFQASRLEADLYPSGIYQYYGKNSFYVPDAMKAGYEEGDVRGYLADADADGLLAQGSPTENTSLITSMKYTNNQSTNYNNDIIYLRLAEVKLTYAEALVRCSGAVTDEAVAQLNDVHSRAFQEGKAPAPYTTADFPSVDAFIEAVLKERNRELAYEGLRRYDLIRTNNLPGDATIGALQPNRWNMPIPNYEVTISEGHIEQNSGY